MTFSELYTADKQRYKNNERRGYPLRFIRIIRKCQCSSGLIQLWYRFLYRRMASQYKLEIPWRLKMGKGLYLGHAYCITVNPEAVIGEWCNIHKGVTIGRQNRGKLKGAPTIGNHVWIGVNATIVGKITIGDDVLIAPNAYVNMDIPSHSVVIGNPAQIHHKENATDGYINNTE